MSFSLSDRPERKHQGGGGGGEERQPGGAAWWCQQEALVRLVPKVGRIGAASAATCPLCVPVPPLIAQPRQKQRRSITLSWPGMIVAAGSRKLSPEQRM